MVEESPTITREFLIQEQFKNRALARKHKQPSAEAEATASIVELHGLTIDEKALSGIAHIGDEELKAYIEAEKSGPAKA